MNGSTTALLVQKPLRKCPCAVVVRVSALPDVLDGYALKNGRHPRIVIGVRVTQDDVWSGIMGIEDVLDPLSRLVSIECHVHQ